MKKALIIFASLMIASIAAYAAPPANSPHMAEYLTKRFVVINGQSSGDYQIDMNEVATVLHDASGYFEFYQFAFPNSAERTGHYWIVLKNGTKMSMGTNNEAQTKYDEYIAFIKLHPEFLTVP